MIELDTRIPFSKDTISMPNVAVDLPEVDRKRVAGIVWDGYQRDLTSRSPWEKRMATAMDLAMQVSEAKNFPWPNCSNTIFPLITIAALQFSARAYAGIVHGTDVVKMRVIGGDPTGVLDAQALRVGAHMSWQVLEQDTSWEEQHDRLFINLAIVGSSFVKTFYSSSLRHNVSELVLARDFVIDYYAKSVEAAARKSHIIPFSRNELYANMVREAFLDYTNEPWFNQPPAYNVPPTDQERRDRRAPPQPDDATPFRCIEQHLNLDLDGDGYAEPYIATIEETTRNLLRLVARVDDDGAVDRVRGRIVEVKPVEYFTKYSFVPSPDGGIYDMGFGSLVGPLNEGVNTSINQIFDAGTMHILGGGFMGRGTKIRGGQLTFQPFEWKNVASTGDDLRKNIIPLPTREPSMVMLQLLKLLIDYTDRLAGTVDQAVGVTPGQNTPAETSRNALEQGMAVYSTIFKRIWRSMKGEFKKLYLLNRKFLPTNYRFGEGNQTVSRDDYKANADYVVPSADPRIVSDHLRLLQAQLIADRAHVVPGYNMEETERRFLAAAKVDGISKVFPGPKATGPLPNPKVMESQMKLMMKKLDIQSKERQFAANLMLNQRKILAEIRQLEAQAMKLAADTEGAKAATQIEAFQATIDAMKAHHEIMQGYLDRVMQGDSNDQSGGGEQGGAGVPGMADASGNAEASGGGTPGSGGDSGQMGVGGNHAQ